MKQGMVFEAEKEYTKSVQSADETGSFYEQAKSYFCRYQYYKSEGQKEEAISDLNRAKQYINEIDYCKWTNSIIEENK